MLAKQPTNGVNGGIIIFSIIMKQKTVTDIRNLNCIATSCNQTTTDCKKDAIVTVIDKTNSVYPKIRERFWIKKLQTLEPGGLNETEKV